MNFFRTNEIPKSEAGSYGAGPEIDPKDLIARFRRRLPLFLGVTALVFGAAAIWTLQQPRVYTAQASVLIDPRKQAVLSGPESQVVSQLPNESGVVDTEAKILASRALAEAVTRRMNLDRDPEFGGDGRLRPQQASIGAARQAPDQSVVDKVMERLDVRRAGLTHVIDVKFTSANPDKAARIANAFADAYLVQQLDSKRQVTTDANGWLSARLDEMRIAAEQADAELQNYKIANGLMSAEGYTLAEQEISVLNQQIALARAEQAEREGRLLAARAQLSRGGGGADTAAALGSDVVRELRAQRAEVSRRKADLSTRYGPLHPEVVKVDEELRDFDSQIASEIRRIQSNLEAEVAVARQRTTSLQGSLGNSRGTLANSNRAMVGLLELERRAEAARAVYETFLTRSRETAAQTSLASADARVVSRAQTPVEPTSPNLRVNFALGLVFALMAGLGSVIAAETLDGGLRTARDINKRLGFRALGSVPMLRSVASRGERDRAPEDYVLARPKSAFSEAFRSLRTAVQISRPDDPVKVIAVASALPKEGKTTTTICLGRLSAAGGSRTVMVDCDVRHRSLSRRFAAGASVGLLEVLAGETSLEDALLLDEPSGAWVLPVAHDGWSDPEVFRSAAFAHVLEDLRARFDFVFLDTPPVLAVAESRVLGAAADAVLYMAAWAKTPEPAVKAALEQLVSAGAEIPGVALSLVDVKQQQQHGYGDTSHYHKALKAYYQD